MKFTLLIPWTIFQLILYSEEEDKSVIYRYYSSSDNREHSFLNFEPDFMRDESFGGLGMRGSAFYMYDLRLAVTEGLLSSGASFPCCSVMYPPPGRDTELHGQRFPPPDLTLLSGMLANVTRARFKTCLPVWMFPLVFLNHITIERTCLKKP